MRISILAAIAFFWMQSVANGGEMIMLGEGDQKFSAYTAGPEDSGKGIIIVHDWFGVSEFTKQSADRFAKNGMKVVAVDLYRGETADNHERAGELLGALDRDYAQRILKTALVEIQTNDRSVALVGYSAGSRFALNAAVEFGSEIDALALLYGGGMEDHADDALKSTAPILLVSGSADDWAYDSNTKLDTKMRELDVHVENYVYPGAGHAFAQPLYDSGKTYDPVATSAMHNVLDHFLERRLNKPE